MAAQQRPPIPLPTTTTSYESSGSFELFIVGLGIALVGDDASEEEHLLLVGILHPKSCCKVVFAGTRDNGAC
eukprot:8109787-Ditylum_brightwellii.AAC.1